LGDAADLFFGISAGAVLNEVPPAQLLDRTNEQPDHRGRTQSSQTLHQQSFHVYGLLFS
jgi:hypothetical protein